MAEHYQFRGTTAAEISASVEAGVRTGALPAGAPLPAVRALASRLGVSPGTVAKAYQVLRQRGVVETAGRHGTRIRPEPPVGARRVELRLPAPPGALDLSIGGPDQRLLPPLWPHLAALAATDGTPIGYERGGVLPELVEAARQRLTADGVPATAVTVTGGASDGIERLLVTHLRPGDAVAVEDPGWANLLDLVAALGLRTVPVPVDEAGPTPAGLRTALAAGARAVVVTSRAQNPTGAAVGADRAAELRAVLGRHPDVLLIEDDHAAEICVEPLYPLAGATRTWAFVRSASKPYGPDLRLAVLTGDEATVARVAGRLRVGSGWISTVLQRLTLALWRDPEVADRIARARRSYADRVAALRTALAERGLAAYGRTGINVWVPVPDETRAVAGLRDAGYVVAPGALFRLRSGPGIRITVSPLADSDIAPLADAVVRAAAPATPPTLSA
ncbi:aminotransferase class I/II-fold pyridoxal phosphate-dependent enzyme [Micromonospora sp. HM5-17]|uniref:aminotransferase class I/II-fold pyridoxal phosphate-dependent enzyme n=1 Tax=Micromonospora sp. HM5-17 TaxID=2487710 RepID=UPI000F4A91F7|nr:aminotransferase class I/II-fold pyridoxal phosphate-dependent enzyme [Micromonospora sp. HM5-17]ROT32844.1 aminotransferase class I/II-fold pyridoxal phosphate-dependent enzyme [Micromonospora sp. HM5-17]